MDPFTQRMLERARARQEKIDQKLASTGQTVPKRKPLTENSFGVMKSESSLTKSPTRTLKSTSNPNSPLKSPNRTDCQNLKTVNISSPQKSRDVVVTKREFKNPRSSGNSRDSDVSVEINIMHRNDIQIEVQVEEREAPMTVIGYDTHTYNAGNVIIQEIENNQETKMLEDKQYNMENEEPKSALSHNIKSRLDRLGVLYSDKPNLSSPIHRTEDDFHSLTPPVACEIKPKESKIDVKGTKKKFGRLAALADQINNWEDDLTQHNNKEVKKTLGKSEKHDASTLDVSIHSYKDINNVLHGANRNNKMTEKKVNSRMYTKQSSTDNNCQRLEKEIVAELEPSASRPPPTPTPTAGDMASALVAAPPDPSATTTTTVVKKPSIKKYRAPTPPKKIVDVVDRDSEKDKENDAAAVEPEVQREDSSRNHTDVPDKASPRRTGLGDGVRSSVLSRAAMFEAGSPRARDPAEMSLRERKALFEKNKGAAVVPRAPFGLAPPANALRSDTPAKATKPPRPAVAAPAPPKPTPDPPRTAQSSEGDEVSLTSLGGGIKGKLAALFSKERTISESTIAGKYKQEREREMEMLQNRFHNAPKQDRERKANEHDSDNENEQEHSERAPLMGSVSSLNQPPRRPEIVGQVPKVKFQERSKSSSSLHDDAEKTPDEDERVVGSQPVKRRSSQDSPVVLSVLDDVKRIKVNNERDAPHSNGATQANGLYPHLSDIETDSSNRNEDNSDCGGSHESPEEALNKSDNWAETSFGREVMNVVKNNSYKQAIRNEQPDSDDSADDDELDELLAEALDGNEGPTPPKINKNGNSISSCKSFEYQQDAEKSMSTGGRFKSPLKAGAGGAGPKSDRGNELVHSVSFYRRMQNASSQPSTPMRVIRHASPERDEASAHGGGGAAGEAARVTTVRERIKLLQEEICKQQTIISQASQALNLCAATIEFSGSTEQAEGERLLLLATHRRQACLHEMQRLQVEGAGPAAAAGAATLHVRGLTVPLRRDYIRQLNADGAVGHHTVCLLKCRDRVLATSMRLTQPSEPCLRFPDDVRMEGLNSDFKITVEIYLLQATKEILPHEVKYHIFNKKPNSKLLTPKSKVSELKTPRVQSPGGPLSVRSPQFQLHGYCIFALPQANRKNFTLNKVPHGSPLEGSLSVEVRARVAAPPPAPHAAFLTAFDDVSGLGAWHRRWFALHRPRLAYWKYPDDVGKKMPIGDIDLATVVSEKAVRAPRDLCARPNTILLECSVPAGIAPDTGSLVYVRKPDGKVVRRHLLAADTPSDRDVWLERLNEALEYVRCNGDSGDE